MNGQPLYDEASLLQGLAGGESSALNKVFDLYFSSLTYFAESIIHDREEAKDIAIITVNKLWERRNSFVSAASIKAFLYIAARNSCLDFLKQKNRRGVVRDDLSFLTTAEQEEEVQRRTIEAELLRKIYQEAQNLPGKCREVFELTYFEGLNTAQISERLNMSVSNVTSQRSRAIQLLKMKFSDQEMLILLALLAIIEGSAY